MEQVILAVDPGTTMTAIVLLDLEAEEVLGRWYLPNPEICKVITALGVGTAMPVFDPAELKEYPNRKPVLDNQVREAIGVAEFSPYPRPTLMVSEMVANYSQTVGRSVFETCIWTGMFIDAFCGGWDDFDRYTLITRTQSRRNITGTSRCGDAQVNRALLDRVGEKGTKKEPGPMFGMKTDLYAALAVGLTYKDLREEFQTVMNSPRAAAVRAGKIKVPSYYTQLEAHGGNRLETEGS